MIKCDSPWTTLSLLGTYCFMGWMFLQFLQWDIRDSSLFRESASTNSANLIPAEEVTDPDDVMKKVKCVLEVATSVSPSSPQQQPRKKRMGDGCWHVYLDAGSNIGVQVRKLFEPHLYGTTPPVLPLFNTYFHLKKVGNSSVNDFKSIAPICAFGWEPNPDHTRRLKFLENRYNKIGWKTKFWTQTAVGISDAKNATFYGSKANNGWSVSIHKSLQHQKEGSKLIYQVPYFDLSRFVLEEIAGRVLPEGDVDVWGPPAVLMKMDIEGGEYELMPHMLFSGSLCHIDLAFVEWHDKFFERLRKDNPEQQLPDLNVINFIRNTLSKVRVLDKECKFLASNLDDETFLYDGKPFPNATTPDGLIKEALAWLQTQKT